MNVALPFEEHDKELRGISPFVEMGAYEYLFAEKDHSFKSLAELFQKHPGALPSDFAPPGKALEYAHRVQERMKQANITDTNIRINGAGEYPQHLRDAKYPIELLYYRGNWEFSETKCVAIVGARKASEAGLKRARLLSRLLVENGFTVVSGLASGIDTAALDAAIRAGGNVIGVIGTPISECYPKENSNLQEFMARKHLIVSQVPFIAYEKQSFHRNRTYFPERNVTMSALTRATIIVEASDTSGTLTQARAAVHQNRKLMILNSCFERSDITWPARFQKQGAIRIHNIEEVLENLDGGEASRN